MFYCLFDVKSVAISFVRHYAFALVVYVHGVAGFLVSMDRNYRYIFDGVQLAKNWV